MICSFFACSLFASVYLSAIATINWQENPTTTTLKVVLIFPSAVCLEAIPTYRVAEVGSLSARAKWPQNFVRLILAISATSALFLCVIAKLQI